MGAAIPLRGDFDAASVRRLAQQSRAGAQSRRLLAVAAIYDGHRRSDAAGFAGVGLQIVRDWVCALQRGRPGRFAGPQGVGSAIQAERGAARGVGRDRRDRSGPGDPRRGAVAALRPGGMAAGTVRRIVGTDDGRAGAAPDGLRQALGAPVPLCPGSGRGGGVQKNFPERLREIRAGLDDGTEVEVWWQDEARVGQKNKIARRWARRGTRPSAPKDQRTTSAYIFGAICPKKGKGAGLVMPRADSHAMRAHLAETGLAIDPGAHAVVILDRAGWHTSSKLEVPHNITLMPLPPRSPELNPVENIWQFMRDNWLSNRVFQSYEDILDHCCQAWNNLVSQPDRIASIGTRKWAHGF